MADRLGPDRTRAQRGMVLSSPVVLLSVVAVLLAGFAFVMTRGAEPTEREIATPVGATESPSATASPTAEPTAEPTRKRKKPVQRADVLVEVYNNSGVTGLAGSVADSATDIGWQVVGADNWYGSIPENTVYYPARLKRAAKQLALDLGIDRRMPVAGAMKGDRLTVILTGEI